MITKQCIRLYTVMLTFIMLTSCRQSNVDGIIIGSKLYKNQDYATNRKLCIIIKRTLGKDKKSLIELTEFGCAGTAGCYDLGYVLTQIINRMGEKEFIKLTNELTDKQKNEILALTAVGLKYGDNNYDNKMDETTISNVFPELEIKLTDPYSCKWGQLEATKDFNNDSLMLIRYGLPGNATNYYWNTLSSDYHVYTKFAVGCIVDEGITCYNTFMKDKIVKKYGKDIFDKASHKADSLFKSAQKQ